MFGPDLPVLGVVGGLWAAGRVVHPQQRLGGVRGAGGFQAQRLARIGEPAVVADTEVQGLRHRLEDALDAPVVDDGDRPGVVPLQGLVDGLEGADELAGAMAAGGCRWAWCAGSPRSPDSHDFTDAAAHTVGDRVAERHEAGRRPPTPVRPLRRTTCRPRADRRRWPTRREGITTNLFIEQSSRWEVGALRQPERGMRTTLSERYVRGGRAMNSMRAFRETDHEAWSRQYIRRSAVRCLYGGRDGELCSTKLLTDQLLCIFCAVQRSNLWTDNQSTHVACTGR